MTVLQDKVVLVSGAGVGLGREIAAAAVRDGARVVLGARKEDNLRAIAEEVDPGGERVAYQSTDMTKPEQCERLVGVAVEKFGGLDAVVNVAARPAFGGLDGADLGQWRKVLDTNVMGTLQMTQAALPALKDGGGSVVLIGSQSMFKPQLPEGEAAYAIAKGALHAAMWQLAYELGPHKIRVNTVVPTWMWGPPVQFYVKYQAEQRGVGEEQVVGELTANMPLGKIPADEDVAEAVVFFASDRSRMVTGQTLFVNAGEYFR